MKHWYEVHMSQEKTIRVYAENSEDAQAKAEAKLNKHNSAWVCNAAYREDGKGDDDFVASS